jgi:iron complex transport system substrate-binding protein
VRGLTLILLAAAALGALGCQESGFDEAKETQRPLKVQHALGESKVPGKAERPVTLGTDALDDTLALGVRPVRAALPGARVPAYLRSRARGVEVVAPLTALDLEATKAVNPDLILGSGSRYAGLYPRLRRRAPTVLSDGGGVAWKLNLRLYGEALGRTNDAERLLIDYDARTARLRERLGDRAAGTKVAVVRVGRDAIWVAGDQSFPGSVIGDLRLAKLPALGGRREHRSVAGNRLAGLDADVVLLSVAPGAEARFHALESRPAWRRLRAVRSGDVTAVDEGTWWSAGGVLAARAAQRDVLRALGA